MNKYWISNIATFLIVITFLLNITEFVENCILSQPKEECWLKFIIIMSIVGILFLLFYFFIWKKCLQSIQNSLYNVFNIHKTMPYIL